MVVQITVHRKSSGSEPRQGQISDDIRIANRNRAGCAQKNTLPDSGVAIRHERNVYLVRRIVVADVLPIDPVEPAVSQLNRMVADYEAIFGEQSSLRSDLHSQDVGPVHTNKFRDMRLTAGVSGAKL